MPSWLCYFCDFKAQIVNIGGNVANSSEGYHYAAKRNIPPLVIYLKVAGLVLL